MRRFPSSLYWKTLAAISTLIVLASCALPPDIAKPAPWDARVFTAPDGSRFPYSTWKPSQPPRAVVIALHGLGGAASDWLPLGQTLPSQGFLVYAPELRGMGNDPETRRVGHLDRRNAWLHDFTSFALRIREEYPRLPIFWYGESLGGVIATRLVNQRESFPSLHPAGFILASPITAVEGKLPRWQEWLLRAGAKLFPAFRLDLHDLLPEDHPPAQVVSTTTHEEQLAHTPHAVPSFSLRLLDEIRRYVRDNQRPLQAGTLPVLILHGGRDLFTPPPDVEAFFHRIQGARKDRLFYPEGYHLLLHDTGRHRVLQDLLAWMESVLEESERPSPAAPVK